MTDTSTPPRTSDGISPGDFRNAGGTEDWPVIGDGATAFFATESFAASARFVEAIAAIDGIEAHRPDVDVRPDGVTIRLLTTETWYGMSRRDVTLARAISATARSLGLAADTSVVQCVHPIVIGAVDPARVMPFWEALTGYIRRPDSPDEDLVDPRGRGPGIWFEQAEDLNTMRPRMHFGLWVPIGDGQARVDAALAAGGRIVFDHGPAWWTMADPEGNEADVSTIENRG
ncbi:MAG TPA: VOC family protein [Candidatus Limnocylindrales bacterium]